jgi:hypothetical protein
MKIEIDYNGAFAVCRIEPMRRPGTMVNFNEADVASQTFALSSFSCIKEHWEREQRLARYKKMPVKHIKRQIQVLPDSIPVLQQLLNEGVIQNLQYELSMNHSPKIEVTMFDDHTTVTATGWLVQDTEGRWWGMDDGYHRMLEEYQKIVIEQ